LGLMRTFVNVVLFSATFFLVASIVWFPENVNGLAVSLYAGLWILAVVIRANELSKR